MKVDFSELGYSGLSEFVRENPERAKKMLKVLYWERMMAPREIGSIFGCSVSTVQRQMNRLGIPLRKRGELSPTVRIRVLDAHRGRKRSFETCLRISTARLGRKPPTFDVLKRLYCDENLKVEEIAQQLNISRKSVYNWLKRYGIPRKQVGRRNPFYGKSHSIKARIRMASKALGRKQSPETVVKRQSTIKAKGSLSGPNNPRYGKPPKHGKHCWYQNIDGQICFRSTYELRVAKAFDQLGIRWEYEPKRFVLRDRTYLPDFYLPDKGLWVEVKGWYHDRHKETIKQFRELYPNERVIVMTHVGIEKLEAIATRKVGGQVA